MQRRSNRIHDIPNHMQTRLPSRFQGIALTALIAGSMIAGATAAEVTDNKRAASNPAITVTSGNLPIILTAPHGGRNAVPDVPARTGNGAFRFTSKSDLNTADVAEKLANALEKNLGKRP